ncbi:MAG: LL-diaminopimelate aminotransferase [Phycisphaerales bacterium]|nr:LL-diaminopimelate aminotransferase [Phycisphaerales bacterium]
MAHINENFLKLTAGYLFPEIARRVEAFAKSHPELASRIVRCGIGDVTEPLPSAIIAALHRGVDQMAQRETFHGYGPPTGHAFVRAAIAEGDFQSRGLDIADDEIFLSDGSKPDASAVLEILGAVTIAVTDPVYPVYVDTNVMAGNTGAALEGGGYAGIHYLTTGPENGFTAEPPTQPVDVAYLCSPNNPTGTVATREQLQRWVAWARDCEAIILFDAAYESFIRDEALPRSIYEISGARECAMEFRSFSKSGGFTGLRCGYTVVPKSLHGRTRGGKKIALHGLWSRRWSTCSNGVSYPVQCAAAALYQEDGRAQCRALVDGYLANARSLRQSCARLGLRCFGGENAPYVWVACPPGVSSWEAFDTLLSRVQLVVTPGAGFGRAGEGYFRVSAFNSRANVEEAGRRLAALTQAAVS